MTKKQIRERGEEAVHLITKYGHYIEMLASVPELVDYSSGLKIIFGEERE